MTNTAINQPLSKEKSKEDSNLILKEEEDMNKDEESALSSSFEQTLACCCFIPPPDDDGPVENDKAATVSTTDSSTTVTSPRTVVEATTLSTNNQYQMIAFDLDGTLLKSDRTISDTTVRFLENLSRNQGILITICTGRSYQSALPHIQRLKNVCCVSVSSDDSFYCQQQRQQTVIPLVCVNGAKGMLVDPHQNHSLSPSHETKGREKEKENAPNKTKAETDTFSATPSSKITTLFSTTFSLSTIKSIETITTDLNYVAIWYYDNKTHAYTSNPDHIRLVKLFERVTTSKQITILPLKKAVGLSSSLLGLPSRIVVLTLDPNIQSIVNKMKSKLLFLDDSDPGVQFIPGPKGLYIEILPSNVHKGHGLQKLCTALQIPTSKCIAIGDADNDIELLKQAGLGICMKNGTQPTKDVADYVGNYTNDEDGVCKALQELQDTGVIHLGRNKNNTTSWYNQWYG